MENKYKFKCKKCGHLLTQDGEAFGSDLIFFMNMKPKQLIIIGGGVSIQEGLIKGLKDKIKDKFIIGCNYAFNFFDNLTLITYVDRDFYKVGDNSFTSKQRKNHKEALEKQQLIIGQKITDKKIKKRFNTYYIDGVSKYTRGLKGGIYKASLVGLYALSLAIYLLDEGEVFLLGFDYGEARKSDYEKFAKSPQELDKLMFKDKQNRPLTHFYQGEINHRGIGKINYYNAKDRANKDFGVYANEQKVKIYNVSLISKISTFSKINYDQFFKMLDNKTYNQKELKKEIIKKLEGLK